LAYRRLNAGDQETTASLIYYSRGRETMLNRISRTCGVGWWWRFSQETTGASFGDLTTVVLSGKVAKGVAEDNRRRE
jgi:hypothetical protein